MAKTPSSPQSADDQMPGGVGLDRRAQRARRVEAHHAVDGVHDLGEDRTVDVLVGHPQPRFATVEVVVEQVPPMC